MNAYSTFAATATEPVPSLSLSPASDSPVLVFSEDDPRHTIAVHLTAIPDLPTWLREFATRLTEFAELVEVREMGAAS